MRFLKIFKGKPLKRVEGKVHSKKGKLRARLSRTSGLNFSAHPFKGLTFNSKHGLRVSKTFKGLTLGFQKGNSVLRGRWSFLDDLININLSKSGFSMSSKSKYGTFNFKNPNRSSFKFAGIQLRGKKAKGPALFFLLIRLIGIFINLIWAVVFPIIFYISQLAFRLSIVVLVFLAEILLGLWHLTMFVLLDLPKQLSSKSNSKD